MEINVQYKDKYLKYKNKYLNLQKQIQQNKNLYGGTAADAATAAATADTVQQIFIEAAAENSKKYIVMEHDLWAECDDNVCMLMICKALSKTDLKDKLKNGDLVVKLVYNVNKNDKSDNTISILKKQFPDLKNIFVDYKTITDNQVPESHSYYVFHCGKQDLRKGKEPGPKDSYLRYFVNGTAMRKPNFLFIQGKAFNVERSIDQVRKDINSFMIDDRIKFINPVSGPNSNIGFRWSYNPEVVNILEQNTDILASCKDFWFKVLQKSFSSDHPSCLQTVFAYPDLLNEAGNPDWDSSDANWGMTSNQLMVELLGESIGLPPILTAVWQNRATYNSELIDARLSASEMIKLKKEFNVRFPQLENTIQNKHILAICSIGEFILKGTKTQLIQGKTHIKIWCLLAGLMYFYRYLCSDYFVNHFANQKSLVKILKEGFKVVVDQKKWLDSNDIKTALVCKKFKLEPRSPPVLIDDKQTDFSRNYNVTKPYTSESPPSGSFLVGLTYPFGTFISVEHRAINIPIDKLESPEVQEFLWKNLKNGKVKWEKLTHMGDVSAGLAAIEIMNSDMTVEENHLHIEKLESSKELKNFDTFKEIFTM